MSKPTSSIRPAAASVLTERHIGPFRLIEAQHPPGTKVRAHAHEHDALSFVVAGAFGETVQSRPFECEPLTALLTPGGAWHKNHFGPVGARTFYVEFLDSTHPLAPPPGAREPTQFRGVPVARGLQLRDGLQRHRGMGDTELQLEELLAASWSRLNPAPRRPDVGPGWLTTVEEMIRTCSADPITLSALAAEVDVHPVYLARVFRDRHRCSISEYRHRVRVDRAVDMIARSEQSLGKIGLSVGFYDQSHFNRIFRREAGTTPGQWRSVSARMPSIE